jgi:hypothetical protein
MLMGSRKSTIFSAALVIPSSYRRIEKNILLGWWSFQTEGKKN